MSNLRPLLNEPTIPPTKEILQENLDKSYSVFEELQAILNERGIVLDWKYYSDSKAWLCKFSFKKKTVFWLSVWNGFFKTSFYFLARHLEGIEALKINETHYTLKQEWGKMIPLIFDISKNEQLADLLKVVEYKKICK